MHLLPAVAALVPLLSTAVAAEFKPASTEGTDELYRQGLDNLAKYEKEHGSPEGCDLQTSAIRKEWSTLKDQEKKDYIAAVKCLQTKPAISGDLVPGARSRYDDFVGTHINQTLSIHGTGNFLSWHRYFSWKFEESLRSECGYEGYLPYLNWGRYAKDLLNAPVFDGSETSMSGNGAFVEHDGPSIPSVDQPLIVLPAGEGGGCITSGPFKDYQTNLGPVAPYLEDVRANPRPDGLGYNPRCLRRDIGAYVAKRESTDANTTALITENTDIGSFQTIMQGVFDQGIVGVHTAGHMWIAGDPGGDLFGSPGDPYFFLHHSQIDRVWWIWQNLDLEKRQNALAGTLTLFNQPPSRNTSLDDVLELGVNDGEGIKIRDAMSTLGGPFCYIYE
ncbi:hypothetical protein MBLNU230_g7416t1 [Neophaeotheca triangularis]